MTVTQARPEQRGRPVPQALRVTLGRRELPEMRALQAQRARMVRQAVTVSMVNKARRGQ